MGIAQNWRLRNQRYALVGEVCDDCGKKIFPPRDVCPYCTQPAPTPFQFSRVTYSITMLPQWMQISPTLVTPWHIPSCSKPPNNPLNNTFGV
jgi:hypothetical protein